MVIRLIKLQLMQLLINFGNLFPDDHVANRLRGYLYKPFMAKCGKRLEIARNVQINNIHKLECGNDVYVGHSAWIFCGEKISFGDGVMIGPFVCITSSNHVDDGRGFRKSKAKWEPIIIESNVWLASHVTVTAGVRISSGSLIAANAVVIGDIPKKSLAAGVPAKVKKHF